MIGSVALLLVCGMVGCGKQNEVVSPLDNVILETSETPVIANNETDETFTEIDIFEDIEITVNDDSDETYDHTYPAEISVKVKSTNPDITDDCFNVEITSANLKTLEYTISADEDALQEYLDENHYILKSAIKPCVTDITELRSYLLSKDYLTEENMQIIYDNMKDKVSEEIEKHNEVANKLIAAGGDGELLDTNIKPVATFAILPDEDIDYSLLNSYSTGFNVYVVFTDIGEKKYYAYQTRNLQFVFNKTWNMIESETEYISFCNGGVYDNFEEIVASIEEIPSLAHIENAALVEVN